MKRFLYSSLIVFMSFLIVGCNSSISDPDFNQEETIQLSLGCYHSSLITPDNQIFTWGYNRYGRLGDGTTTNRLAPLDITSQFRMNAEEKIIQVSLSKVHSSAITSEGRIFTWGLNGAGELGDGTTIIVRTSPVEITSQFNLNEGETIIQVSLGGMHSSAITSDGRIFTWGLNYS